MGHKGHADPVWLHPEKPEFWERQKAELDKMAVRLAEASKSKMYKFKVPADDRIIVDEAIQKALEHTGTASPGKALDHICQTYLAAGPHVQAFDRMEARARAKKIGLEHLMKEAGPDMVLETFKGLFPEYVKPMGRG